MTTKNVLGFVSVLLLAASPVRAQAVQSVGARLEGELAKRVLWDEPGNGELWAAGLTYKASFTPAGTTFVPVLGAAAPRNTPVAFALASVTVAGEPVALGAVARPEHAGERVVFDHGRVREVWDARPTELEQTFELDLARHDGEVVVRLDVATELERVRDERGLAFVGEHGSVRYSNAVAWDARHVPVAKTGATAWSSPVVCARMPFASSACNERKVKWANGPRCWQVCPKRAPNCSN